MTRTRIPHSRPRVWPLLARCWVPSDVRTGHRDPLRRGGRGAGRTTSIDSRTPVILLLILTSRWQHVQDPPQRRPRSGLGWSRRAATVTTGAAGDRRQSSAPGPEAEAQAPWPAARARPPVPRCRSPRSPGAQRPGPSDRASRALIPPPTHPPPFLTPALQPLRGAAAVEAARRRGRRVEPGRGGVIGLRSPPWACRRCSSRSERE